MEQSGAAPSNVYVMKGLGGGKYGTQYGIAYLFTIIDHLADYLLTLVGSAQIANTANIVLSIAGMLQAIAEGADEAVVLGFVIGIPAAVIAATASLGGVAQFNSASDVIGWRNREEGPAKGKFS